MATLKDRIDEYKQQSAGKATDEMVAIMSSAKNAVRESLAGRKIPGKGDQMPAFGLVGSDGSAVDSKTLLSNGPLVISFFRGMW